MQDGPGHSSFSATNGLFSDNVQAPSGWHGENVLLALASSEHFAGRKLTVVEAATTPGAAGRKTKRSKRSYGIDVSYIAKVVARSRIPLVMVGRKRTICRPWWRPQSPTLPDVSQVRYYPRFTTSHIRQPYQSSFRLSTASSSAAM